MVAPSAAVDPELQPRVTGAFRPAQAAREEIHRDIHRDHLRAARRATGESVLVVECDGDQGRSLVEQLAADGYRVQLARTVEHARVLASASPPKLALLGELDSPRGALELLEEIRASAWGESPWDAQLPTIILGAREHELDMLRAFDAGADDFLARPARYLELRARLRAILRRLERVATRPTLEVGSLTIDLDARAVSVEGRRVDLRPMEFELLVHLARDPQRVCAKGELLRVVWAYMASGSTRTVDSHASRLRRKLELDGGHPWVINVWGVGYRLI
jgi:DNA-binding response OmpR family regulator